MKVSCDMTAAIQNSYGRHFNLVSVPDLSIPETNQEAGI